MNFAAEPAREEKEIEVTFEHFNLTVTMTEKQARDLMNQIAMKLHEQ